MEITPQCVVALTWTLKDSLGDTLDELEEPVEFLVGSDDLLPAISGALQGHERGELLRVPLTEVLYLKAEQKYVTLRTAHRTLLLDESLAELEERLGRRFLRIHRNALVALDAVAALERRRWSDERGEAEASEVWAVRIAATDEWLAVSRRQLASVRDLLAAEGL